ncbi:MAG: esterase/lipase family protein [Alteromonas sp.]
MFDELAPPTKRLSLREIQAPLDWLQTIVTLPQLLSMPKGDGRPVLLAPGFMTDKWSMRPLKGFLDKLGYDVYDWNLGRNRGDVDEDIVRLGRQTLELSLELDRPITLIGWSLGGVLCREVARLFPDAVSEVITMGTPVTGGPKYTAPGKRYAAQKNIDMDELEIEIAERNAIGFSQPITVLFSKLDGIVSWQAALDVYNQQARHIEIDGTHLGIGFHRDSWRAIAYILAGQSEQLTYTELDDLLAG